MLLAPGVASAAGPETFRLDYELAPAARSCVGADVLRAKIAERLGRDPFEPTSGRADERTRVLSVGVRRAGDRGVFSAEIRLLEYGKVVGRRLLDGDAASCDSLASAIVLTVAVLLEDPPDPNPTLAPSTLGAPPDAERAAEPAPVPPPPPAGPPARLRLDVAMGALASFGVAPSPAAGGEARLGVDRDRFRLELGARGTLPASSDDAIGVRTRLVVGTLAPCYGLLIVSGCLAVNVGAISGEAVGASVARSSLGSAAYAAVGAAAVSRVFFGDVLFARASIEATFALTRVGFDVGANRAWTVPLAGATGSLGVGARLP